MNRTDISRILLEYEKLQNKVMEVSYKLYESGIDYQWYQISAKDIASIDKMEIDDLEAWIYDTTYGWGGSVNEISTVIPINWLFLSDDELFKVAKAEKHRRNEEEKRREEEKQRLKNKDMEKREREEYEKLKAKFENK